VEIYYVDGKFVPANEASIPVNDLALLRGLGVFDLLRTYGGRPFFLEEHLERLENSARKIGLPMPWSRRELTDIVLETLARNNCEDANIRVVVTGGSSSDFMTPQGNPRLLVLVNPVPTLPAEWYTDGVKIITIVTERPMTGAKSISYIPATIALKKAREENAVEAIYITRDNCVQEGTTSNIFAFINGKLVTPGRGILSGITRRVILNITRELYDTDIRDITRSELLKADEIFITGTNKGLVPVIQVDETRIGNGRPGTLTRNVMKLLSEHTARYASTTD